MVKGRIGGTTVGLHKVGNGEITNAKRSKLPPQQIQELKDLRDDAILAGVETPSYQQKLVLSALQRARRAFQGENKEKECKG